MQLYTRKSTGQNGIVLGHSLDETGARDDVHACIRTLGQSTRDFPADPSPSHQSHVGFSSSEVRRAAYEASVRTPHKTQITDTQIVPHSVSRLGHQRPDSDLMLLPKPELSGAPV